MEQGFWNVWLAPYTQRRESLINVGQTLYDEAVSGGSVLVWNSHSTKSLNLTYKLVVKIDFSA